MNELLNELKEMNDYWSIMDHLEGIGYKEISSDQLSYDEGNVNYEVVYHNAVTNRYISINYSDNSWAEYSEVHEIHEVVPAQKTITFYAKV